MGKTRVSPCSLIGTTTITYNASKEQVGIRAYILAASAYLNVSVPNKPLSYYMHTHPPHIVVGGWYHSIILTPVTPQQHNTRICPSLADLVLQLALFGTHASTPRLIFTTHAAIQAFIHIHIKHTHSKTHKRAHMYLTLISAANVYT